MKRKKSTKVTNDGMSIKGFFRMTIEEGGRIVGDTGYFPNQVGNVGIEQYAAYGIGASAGSKQLAYFALGSGGSMATDGTTIPSEVLQASKRASISAKSFSSRTVSNGSASLYLYGQFASADSFVNNSYNISNIGIGNSISGGTLFCVQTYNSSQVSTNQNVNVTYQIQIG
jgi:hypothetical protein